MNVPLIYKTKELEVEFRCDLFVENFLVVRLKPVLKLNPIVEAKVQVSMKLIKAPMKISINFNCFTIFKE
ncbi:MAG: GxxExxY protein [Flavobacterium sp.]|jgi:GxxExxY protein